MPGGVHNSTAPTRTKGAARARKGLRRPQRERRVSDQWPINGSMTASHRLAMVSRTPIRASGRYCGRPEVGRRGVEVQQPGVNGDGQDVQAGRGHRVQRDAAKGEFLGGCGGHGGSSGLEDFRQFDGLVAEGFGVVAAKLGAGFGIVEAHTHVDQRLELGGVDPGQAGLVHAHGARLAQQVVNGQHHLAAVGVQGPDLALDGGLVSTRMLVSQWDLEYQYHSLTRCGCRPSASCSGWNSGRAEKDEASEAARAMARWSGWFSKGANGSQQKIISARNLRIWDMICPRSTDWGTSHKSPSR